MLPAPTTSPSSPLADTAVQAAGGGVLLALDVDRARSGLADAFVLRRGRVLRVSLDAALGTVVLRPAGAPEPLCSAA